MCELLAVGVEGFDRRGLCDAASASGRLREALDAFDARAADTVSADAVEQSDLLTKATNRPADLLDRDVRDWTRRRQTQTDLEQQHAIQVTARRCVIFDADNAMTVLHAEFDPITGAKIRAAIDTTATTSTKTTAAATPPPKPAPHNNAAPTRWPNYSPEKAPDRDRCAHN